MVQIVPEDRFLALIEGIIRREGGVVRLPDGPGGQYQETRFGQTPGWLADFGLPVPNTIADAALNYEAWLRKTHLADLCYPPDSLAEQVIDFAVHSGAATAIKHLQALVEVEQDGRLGPKTLAAVAYHTDRQYLARRLFRRRCQFLGKVLQDPHKAARFAEGWLDRLGQMAERL